MSAQPSTPARSLVQEGLRHQRAERAAEAASCYERALALDPRNFDALQFLGVVRFRDGDPDAGITLLQQALALHPNHSSALNNLGNALRAAGRMSEALAAYRRAVALVRPPKARFLLNLGSAQLDMGQWTEAAGNLRCAAALEPGDAVAWCWVGHLERALENPEAALEAFGRAIALEPDLVEAHRGIGCIHRWGGRPIEARAAYEKVLQLAPQHPLVRLMHADVSLSVCEWSGLSARFAELSTVTPQASHILEPLSLMFMTDDPLALRAYAEAGATRAESAAPAVAKSRSPQASGGPRVRLGYLSGDIHDHPVARLLAGVLDRHDRTRFEVTVYALGRHAPSAARRRVAESAEHFVPLEFPTDQELAERIVGDEQAILVDLMGHTALNRNRVLAARPAAVQASWLGYPGTLGGTLVDYLITDGFTTPEGTEEYYSEQLVRLPHSLLPGDASQVANAPLPRAACGLSESAVVLCSFTQNRKLNPRLFDVWMAVMREVPEALLWLTEEHPLAVTNLRKEAAQRGVEGHRLVFAPRAPSAADYLARYRVADLALDTFPYNSHSTAADVLWAGCPLVTMSGRSFASRVCGSVLRTAGLPELVTGNPDEYRDLVIRLARDRAARESLRSRLETTRPSSPLFDVEVFTRSLERAYLAMHERALQALPPTHLWIS
jgi:protein O-GlcNAc transferase